MKVRRLALRTVETYLGWQRRFLNWAAKQDLEPASKAAVEGFITWLAVERKVSAGTQNQAFSAVLFLTSEVMEQPVEGVDGVRAKRSRYLPVVLSREEVRRLLAVMEGTTGLILRLLWSSSRRKQGLTRSVGWEEARGARRGRGRVGGRYRAGSGRGRPRCRAECQGIAGGRRFGRPGRACKGCWRRG
jgi:integrase